MRREVGNKRMNLAELIPAIPLSLVQAARQNVNTWARRHLLNRCDDGPAS